MASWKKRRECKRCRKRIHVTLKAAQAALDQQPYPLYMYPCPYGHGYHLSTDHTKYRDLSCLPANAPNAGAAATAMPQPPCEPNTQLAA